MKKRRGSSIVTIMIVAAAVGLTLFTAVCVFGTYKTIRSNMMNYSKAELANRQAVVEKMIVDAKKRADNDNVLGKWLLEYIVPLVGTNDYEHINQFCELYLASVGETECAVYAYDKTLISDPKYGEFKLDFVASIIGGKTDSYIERNANTGTIDVVYGNPIKLNGQVIGAFISRCVIIDQNFAMDVKATTDCDFSLFNDATHAYTSINGMQGRATRNTVPHETIKAGADHYETEGQSNGVKFLGYYFPVRDQNGNVVEILFIEEKVSMVEKTINAVLIEVIIMSIIAVVIMIFLATSLVIRVIKKPLNKINAAVKDLSEGEANLTARLSEKGTQEISMLATHFNRFIERVQDIVAQVKGTQESLTSICENLNVTSQESASATSQIMANIQGVRKQSENQAEAVNNANTTLTKSASSIGQMQTLIENQSASISESSVAIEEMLSNISSVSNSVHKTSDSFKELDESVVMGKDKLSNVYEKINLISDQSKMLVQANQMISQIASETNLLAMNASIEAAHAGDAGKGFAVVANEIRKLAENSSKQSKEITEELNQITESIQAVVSLSKDSQVAFENIVTCINTTDVIIREIDNAMNEQENASKQIFNTLSGMRNITVDVNDKIKVVSSEMLELSSGMDSVSQVSSTILGSMDEMATGAQQISTAAQEVSNLANETKDNVHTIDEKLNLFTV